MRPPRLFPPAAVPGRARPRRGPGSQKGLEVWAAASLEKGSCTRCPWAHLAPLDHVCSELLVKEPGGVTEPRYQGFHTRGPGETQMAVPHTPVQQSHLALGWLWGQEGVSAMGSGRREGSGSAALPPGSGSQGWGRSRSQAKAPHPSILCPQFTQCSPPSQQEGSGCCLHCGVQGHPLGGIPTPDAARTQKR